MRTTMVTKMVISGDWVKEAAWIVQTQSWTLNLCRGGRRIEPLLKFCKTVHFACPIVQTQSFIHTYVCVRVRALAQMPMHTMACAVYSCNNAFFFLQKMLNMRKGMRCDAFCIHNYNISTTPILVLKSSIISFAAPDSECVDYNALFCQEPLLYIWHVNYSRTVICRTWQCRLK